MSEANRSCNAHRDRLAMLVSDDLRLPELAETREHLKGCADCRAHLEALLADADRLTGLVDACRPRLDDMRARTIEAVPDEPPRRRIPEPVRWIMATGTRRTLAAAALAAIAFIAVFMGGTDNSFDAWAEVAELIGQARSCRYRISEVGRPDVETVHVHCEHGMIDETFEDGVRVESQYIDFAARTMVYEAPSLDVRVEVDFDRAMTDYFQERSPARLFEFLGDYEHHELGSRRVEGRKAVGIRVTDARFLAERLDRAEMELWVDPVTKLPLSLEVEGELAVGRHRHVRFYDFEWDRVFDPDAFRPDNVRDLDVTRGIEIRLNEQGYTDGLRRFAEITDRYPLSLAYESAREELWEHFDHGRDRLGAYIGEMYRLRASCEFHGRLVSDRKNAAWFGDRVRPGDADRVLARWKTGEDAYRVVWGDLKTETLTGAELLQAEGR